MSKKLNTNDIYELLDGYNSELDDLDSGDEFKNKSSEICAGK